MCPAGSLRNLNFPFAVTSRAPPGQDRRSVDPKNRPPPIARGAVPRSRKYISQGAVAFTFVRETAHGRRAIRIVTMILDRSRAGSPFYRFNPTGPACVARANESQRTFKIKLPRGRGTGSGRPARRLHLF